MKVTEQDLQRNATYPALFKFLAVYLGLLILFMLGVGLYQWLTGVNLIDSKLWGYPMLYVDAILFLVAVLAVRAARTIMLHRINISALKSWRTWLYVMLGFLLFQLIQYATIDLFQVDDPSSQADDLGLTTMEPLSVEFLLFFIAATVVAPIREELMFRAFLHRFFELRHHFLVGLLLSSLLFGLLHVGFPFSTTLMGALLVLLYRLTRSISAPILLHALWNTYATFLHLISY